MRLISCRFVKALAFALGMAVLGFAQAASVRADHIEAELVAATTAVKPGESLLVALRLKHDKDWHTYWQVPGDSGLPTQLKWSLPEGWTASALQWPVPHRMPVGPLVNFGYEGEVLLLAQLTPPTSLATGTDVTLKARADWLICQDVCIPGGADLTLSLPVAATSNPSFFAGLFDVYRQQIPQPLQLSDAKATLNGSRVQFAFSPNAASAIKTLEFFPLEEARIEPAAKQVLAQDNKLVSLELTAVQPVAADFKALRGVLVANGGPAKAQQGGWAGVVELPLTIAAGGASASAAVNAVAPQITDLSGGSTSVTFWGALIGAVIGGLILNLMPCVFPVLSLKLLSLMQHQQADNSQHVSMRAHGAAFAVGVIVSFLLLAGLLLALRAGGATLGWGFQLQTPWVVASLAGLFFVIGLNLLGAFEFNVGTGMANSDMAQKLQSNQLSGSFWTGVLAVVVAAPCTAPFMGAALGYAATQPAVVALLVFAMLGVGMALPYVLLTLFPALLKLLPRPGVWMERFKQTMAFPMFATAVWLFWVLAQQVDANGVAITLAALVLIGMAAWAFGLSQRGVTGFRWVALGAFGLAVYAVISATGPQALAQAQAVSRSNHSSDWQAWSRALINQQVAKGTPVFVDFTAAWCVTCQANKRLVLHTESISTAFKESGVTRVRADWTNRDDEITRELASFNRNGVPLYVLYDRSGRAFVLPELLTEGIVLEALARVKN